MASILFVSISSNNKIGKTNVCIVRSSIYMEWETNTFWKFPTHLTNGNISSVGLAVNIKSIDQYYCILHIMQQFIRTFVWPKEYVHSQLHAETLIAIALWVNIISNSLKRNKLMRNRLFVCFFQFYFFCVCLNFSRDTHRWFEVWINKTVWPYHKKGTHLTVNCF